MQPHLHLMFRRSRQHRQSFIHPGRFNFLRHIAILCFTGFLVIYGYKLMQKRLKDDGMLDTSVRNFSTNYHYNGWNEAVLGGLQAAKDAGVISQQELDGYAAGLTEVASSQEVPACPR